MTEFETQALSLLAEILAALQSEKRTRRKKEPKKEEVGCDYTLEKDSISKEEELASGQGPSCHEIQNLSTGRAVNPRTVMDAVVDEWNSLAESYGLPKATKIAGKREVLLRARLAEFGLADFSRCMSKIASIPGLRGENNRGWKADFDWLIQPMTMAKILEGKYDKWGVATPANLKVIRNGEDPYK